MTRRIVILGGGVAGLEALMALHDLAGDRAELTLVAPEPDFVYKPLLVEEPFDLGPAERHALGPLAGEIGAEFVQQAVTSVQADMHTHNPRAGSARNLRAERQRGGQRLALGTRSRGRCRCLRT